MHTKGERREKEGRPSPGKEPMADSGPHHPVLPANPTNLQEEEGEIKTDTGPHHPVLHPNLSSHQEDEAETNPGQASTKTGTGPHHPVMSPDPTNHQEEQEVTPSQQAEAMGMGKLEQETNQVNLKEGRKDTSNPTNQEADMATKLKPPKSTDNPVRKALVRKIKEKARKNQAKNNAPNHTVSVKTLFNKIKVNQGKGKDTDTDSDNDRPKTNKVTQLIPHST